MTVRGDELLKHAFDIMSCNDPRQPILAQIATYLKAQGFHLEEEEWVDDTHRFIVDTGHDGYNYQIELVTGKDVGLRAALGLGRNDPLPEGVVQTSDGRQAKFTYTC